MAIGWNSPDDFTAEEALNAGITEGEKELMRKNGVAFKAAKDLTLEFKQDIDCARNKHITYIEITAVFSNYSMKVDTLRMEHNTQDKAGRAAALKTIENMFALLREAVVNGIDPDAIDTAKKIEVLQQERTNAKAELDRMQEKAERARHDMDGLRDLNHHLKQKVAELEHLDEFDVNVLTEEKSELELQLELAQDRIAHLESQISMILEE